MAVEVTVTDYPMFIDGASAPSSSGRWIEVRSPATRELVGRVPEGTAADVDRAVAAARAAFQDGRWSRMALGDRVTIMNRLGDLLDRDADDLARLETFQTGTSYKLRRESDFVFASDNLRFFATQIRNLEGKAAYEYTGTHTSFVRREPIGVVGQVSPWNYPMWMAIWKIGPAQAGVGDAAHDGAPRRTGVRGRDPGRCLQRRDRPGRHGRRGARGPHGRRSHLADG
jgi:acyl-CoA reductase-like NAD-dependent aldehyde dehydrogenase